MAAVKQEQIHIGPQSGPQAAFLACQADIGIYGGAAGGGKSYGLLLDPLRHYHNPDFGGVIFRKTSVQVRNEGGLWDDSMKLYSLFNARPRESTLEWRFPKGMAMSFANLELEKDVLNYQGAQIPWQGWDELTHFSRQQFFYMLSRNRSTSGVRPRIRATCNPDPDSWVREFIDWWIDKESGLPIPERAGVLRYFIRINDEIIWANSKEEIWERYGQSEDIQPKSVTFIPAKLEDNRILMKMDPTYKATLLALNRVDRERLLKGNWNIRANAGSLFQRGWFQVVDAIPSGWQRVVRCWDRAATVVSETSPDPDWTRGLLMYKYPNGTFCVANLRSTRDTPGKVDNLIHNTASQDSISVEVVSAQDPGSAGVGEAEHFTRMLSGYIVNTFINTKDKVTRAKPVSSASEHGNIMVLRAPWNNDFFSELENFGEDYTGHDDIVDTFSGAFNHLCGGFSLADVL